MELNDNFVNEYENKKIIFTNYLPEIVRKVQEELDSINAKVFRKDYCFELTFRAEYVKIRSQAYEKSLIDIGLCDCEKTQKANDQIIGRVSNNTILTANVCDSRKKDIMGVDALDRKPADSTLVTM